MLMSGNEAIARGAYEAGVKVCAAYPGTPSTEILEELRGFTEERFPDWKQNPYSKTLPRLKRLALFLVSKRQFRLVRFLFNLKG